MKLYLDEFTEEELLRFAEKAYGAAKFDDPKARRPSSRSEKTAISWSCGTVRRARSRTWRCRCSRIFSRQACRKPANTKRSAFSSQPPATPARQRSRVSVMWTIREFSSSTPTAACPRSRSCRWSARRAKTSACARCAETSTTRRAASSAFSPTPFCARSWRAEATSCRLPTPSTGARAAADRVLHLRLL